MIELNKIYNEDCLVGMQRIPDKSIDCIICDLPYGTTACKWDSIIPFDKLWEQYKRIITNKGAIVLFGQEPFSSQLRCSNIEWYRYDIVWKKQRPSNFQLMNYQVGRVTENIMIFSNAKACYVPNGVTMTFNPQMTEREKPRTANAKIYGDKSKNILHDYKSTDNVKTYTHKLPINVLEFNTVEKGKLHPTQKPLKLIEYLVLTYSNEGDTILDNCMGSGTTAIACMNTGRNFLGFELEQKYFEIANDRITKAQWQKTH